MTSLYESMSAVDYKRWLKTATDRDILNEVLHLIAYLPLPTPQEELLVSAFAEIANKEPLP